MRLHNLAIALAVAGCFAAFSATPARADSITLGSSTQYVILTNAGSGTIDVTFGGGTVSGNTSNPTGTYSMTITSSPATFTGPNPSNTQDFLGSDAITLTVDGTPYAAILTQIYSDGGVDFRGTYGPSSLGFDFTLNTLQCVTTASCASGPATSAILTTLAGDPVGTEWEATISSGQVQTPEPSMAKMLAMGLLAIGLAGAFFRREGVCAVQR